MRTFVFGKTGLVLSRTGYGCLPIQRVTTDEAVALLRRAREGGINYFDTARGYTDSEEKLGIAFEGVRESVIISTKTHAKTPEEFWAHLKTSLEKLRTDYIDIYQFHNAQKLYEPGASDGMYDAMLEAKKRGLIRHIGITSHSIDVAEAVAKSGLYESLQYPFSHLATDREIAMVRECEKNGVGFIAMKALSGGLVTDARLPFMFINDFEGAVPIWGMQRMSELEQILDLSNHVPVLTDELRNAIEKDRAELRGSFCRACGYCLPCPAGINIPFANRAKQLLTRSPYERYMTDETLADMEKIGDCIRCEACASRCPYSLKPFETMPGQLEWFRGFYSDYKKQKGLA